MKHNHPEPHHHHSDITEPGRVFKIVILLNLLFVGIEVYFGMVDNSLALVSDGIHNLTDVFGLTFAWVGYLFSKNQATKKFSIYAAFINTSLIILTSIWITAEAFRRYQTNQTPVALTIISVAFVGLIINFFTAQLFHKEHHHDLNMKSAYLHLMTDAAISLGVVFTGLIIYFTNITWVDPVISGIISVIIIFTTWPYLKESWNMLSGKKPSSVNIEDVKKSIMQQPEITDVTAILIWSLSTSENALTAEIHVSARLNEEQLSKIKHRLYHEFKMTLVVLNQIKIGHR